MGCACGSGQAGGWANERNGQGAGKEGGKEGGGESGGTGTRLLEEYSVGATLGEGAFGVVSNCTKRATGEQFAVKMVDKVETPVEAIRKEAEMLKQMNHPNIVKCHGVFFERCFVCIVMDKYSGGDLVEGLQRHLKERGQINCQDVVHVASQMGASIAHLHGKMVVHRDIKGDNYLMDRKDITHQECKIVLTDFGTAIQIRQNERLSAGVGTKIFWSPEFYDRDYGLKVDVWAMGVILYGLVSGRFPFKDQNDIKTKEVKIPKRVHPTCEEFIRKQLEKNEKDRLTADEVMLHVWITSNGAKGSTATQQSDGKDDDVGAKDNFKEDAVNDDVKGRRQELIHRLNREHNAKGAEKVLRKKSHHHLQKTFHLNDKMMQGARFLYEWWDEKKAAKMGLLDLEKQAKPSLGQEPSTPHDLTIFKAMLEEHKIQTVKFGVGKAKTLGGLCTEAQSGACRLMLDATEHKKLVRVADIVVFRLLSPAGIGKGAQRLLVETSEMFASKQRRETNRLPGTKKEPYENARQTAERILREYLNISPECVAFDLSNAFRYEEEIESPSYPGVRTVYRKEIVEASIKEMDTTKSAEIGLPGFTEWSFKDKSGNQKTFNWMTEETAKSKKVKIRAEGAEVVSTLVRAPIGMNEEQLRDVLTKSSIDVAKYGQSGKTKTLKEFSAELIRGEATFFEGMDGNPMRVVDVVLLIIRNPQTNEILVQTAHEKESHKTTLNRLPGAKCRPDENQFLSARRILRRQLEIDENDVNLVQEVLMVEEEKPTDFYPGLKTVYRKRLIKAELVIKPA